MTYTISCTIRGFLRASASRVTRWRSLSCPSWDRTRTLLIQSQRATAGRGVVPTQLSSEGDAQADRLTATGRQANGTRLHDFFHDSARAFSAPFGSPWDRLTPRQHLTLLVAAGRMTW